VSDFEYELQIAHVNKTQKPGLDTVFLTASAEYIYLSSGVVREVARHGGDISMFVHPDIASRVKKKLNIKK
jgi:pantetheine-phosphate adenylyltransferase